jgi:hypothetical protein
MTGNDLAPCETIGAVGHCNSACVTCGAALKRSECFRVADGAAVMEDAPAPNPVQCLTCAITTPPVPDSSEAKIWERL